MKRLFLTLVLIITSVKVQTACYTDRITPMNFGTVTYVTDDTGYKTIQITRNANTATPSGSGNMASPDLQVTRARWYVAGCGTTSSSRTLYEKINTTGSVDITTPGCGTIRISNLQLYNGKTTYTPSMRKDSSSDTIAGTVQLISFEGSAPCTITGTLSGAYGWYLSSEGSTYKNEDIEVSLAVIGGTGSFSHDTGAELNFGTFCKASQTQNLTILPNGTVATSSTVCPVSADISADSFTFISSQASSFSVAVPSTPVTLTNPITGSTLQVSNFQPSCTSSCTVLNNTATVTVGGTLTVPGNAAIGDYTGSYPVSITY